MTVAGAAFIVIVLLPCVLPNPLPLIVTEVPTGPLFGDKLVIAGFGMVKIWSVLLLGAECLVMVVLIHLCEALRLLSWMQWGSEHSVGHYLDLGSAVLGLTLFPVGYLLHALAKRQA